MVVIIQLKQELPCLAFPRCLMLESEYLTGFYSIPIKDILKWVLFFHHTVS